MSLTQNIKVKSSPDAIYDALLSSKTFSAFTGAPAQIDKSDGGQFSCFGGQISGRQIEKVVNKRIVQAWRAGPWPEGLYSIVRFDLEETGDSTNITLTHSGFPEEMTEHLDGGWHKMYWEPMKKHFDK